MVKDTSTTPTGKIRPQRILGACMVGALLIALGAIGSAFAPSNEMILSAQNFGPEGPVLRGPYLQLGTPTSMTVRWRTEETMTGLVRYGESPTHMDQFATGAEMTTEHVVRLGGLMPNTRYYYGVGNANEILVGADAEHSFVTAPISGTAKRTRMWVIGDSGTPFLAAVKAAYLDFAAGIPTDVFLMLGDNAYPDGTDWQYQAVVFGLLQDLLRQTPVWSTIGNHDGKSADSSTQTGVYYDVFSFPTQGEAGGLASGTEAYYSFDYANVHFICLNSNDLDRTPSGAMLQWLEADLAETSQDWTIAFWHHPPYSKGSHDSDEDGSLIQMREYAVPMLEEYGVDLVLAGHSHAYERSFLADGHYGNSISFSPSMLLDDGDGRPAGDGPYEKASQGAAPHEGAVYVVAGNSGVVDPEGRLDHPIMYVGMKKLGSLILDVDNNVLQARMLNWEGEILDDFTIVKGGDTVPETPTNLAVQVIPGSQADLLWTDNADNEQAYVVERSPNGSGWMPLATLPANTQTYSDVSATGTDVMFYRVQARNAEGWSSWSNVASTDDEDTSGCAHTSTSPSQEGLIWLLLSLLAPGTIFRRR